MLLAAFGAQAVNSSYYVRHCMGISLTSVLLWILLFAGVAYWDIRFVGIVLYGHFLTLMTRRGRLFVRVFGAYIDKYSLTELKKRHAGYGILPLLLYIVVAELSMEFMADNDGMAIRVGGGMLLFFYIAALAAFYFFLANAISVEGAEDAEKALKKIGDKKMRGHAFVDRGVIVKAVLICCLILGFGLLIESLFYFLPLSESMGANWWIRRIPYGALLLFSVTYAFFSILCKEE